MLTKRVQMDATLSFAVGTANGDPDDPELADVMVLVEHKSDLLTVYAQQTA